MPTGEHTVTVAPADGSAAVDISCLVDTVTIRHGRDDSTSQPEASAVTLDISRDPLGEFTLPAALDIGAVIHVSTTTGGGLTADRFVGTATDLVLGWDDDGEDTPDAGEGSVTATGPMDKIARQVVGDEPWLQELDGSRVSRIMAAAGVVLNPATSDPGTVQILARDVDSQAALDLARGVAESASGMVWETRGGEVRYADAAHRRGIASSLTLDACDILITPTWRRTLEGLVNAVSLGYGVAPEGGEQPRYLASNETSKGRWGTYEYSFTTELATLADASALGNLLMGRNSSPVWLMVALPVDVEGLDDDRYAALLGLEMHSLITLTGLPAIGSAPTTSLFWVEGWTETLGPGIHEIELVVSGYCRTVPPPRWDDVDPAWTWDTIRPPSMTWDDATCWGPPVDFGRWNDVPASLRWDAIPASVTWDTWDH